VMDPTAAYITRDMLVALWAGLRAQFPSVPIEW
jgi:hypothetical protein